MPDSQTATALLCMTHGPQPDICPRCAAAKVLEAAKALEARLAAMEEPIKTITVSAWVYGVVYDGPTWTEERNALRAAVAEFEKGEPA